MVPVFPSSPHASRAGQKTEKFICQDPCRVPQKAPGHVYSKMSEKGSTQGEGFVVDRCSGWRGPTKLLACAFSAEVG